ncbi:unnamed protein product [Adineta ricciae]|uniref:Amino acid transporter transmembrane domain-containing protein n=1 Tax=Adineta ricciae TaxID=249248 RepID=A0A814INJ5_ADIRI|nr:unnamed protein product [Adineta ricciae]
MGLGANLWKILSHYSQFYFVSIASVLGTGILGLPVTLSESGFRPFILSFVICYFVQILTIFFFTEVLQKAYYRNIEQLQENDKDNAPIHLEKHELHTYGSDYDLSSKQGGTHPIIFHFCQAKSQQFVFSQTIEYEKSSIPTIILYVVFILLTLLSFVWIYISYSDIAKLKRKRLATVFFYSLVLTKFKNHERSKMVTQTLKRLLSICLFILNDDPSNVPLMTNDDDDDDDVTTSVTNTKYYIKTSYKADIIKRCLPNLHSLGELLLPCFLRQVFTGTVLLALLCILISYALAGSQAFTALFNIPYIKMIPIFCWTWTFVVVFLHSFIQPIISILTFLKGTLFTATVIVTLLVGLKIQNPVKNDYSAIGDSFLMSTIALGGLMNVMPMMFAKLKQTREEIIGFNVSVFLGLTTCVILNILWCWSILAVVPQSSTCLSTNINDSVHIVFNLMNDSQIHGQCIQSPSLKKSALNGEISTVPLSQILENGEFSYFQYVSFIVQLFIITSISVSFMTMGSALHHTIKGVVDSYWSPTLEAETSLRKYGSIFEYITVRRIAQWIASLLIFSIVFGIAMSNPKGFKLILEQAASLFQNVEVGLFLSIMIYKVSTREYNHYILPFQLPSWSHYLKGIIPVYFLFAVFYDIYHIVRTYLK